VRQRLLAVDVHAQLDGRHRGRGVKMVGRGDEHRVDLLVHLVEHLAVVGEGLGKRPVEIPLLLQSLGAPLLLHIPRAGRLACPVNLASLHRICREFPRLRLVLAHVGRSYGLDQSPPVSEFRKLARHENLCVEFAMVQSVDVVKVCLETFGWERCIFGTDLPIAELKGKVVTVNGQNLFVTRKPYPWSVSPVSAVNLRCTFFAYEIVRAIVTAMKQLGLKSRARDAIFRKNAERIYVRSRTH